MLAKVDEVTRLFSTPIPGDVGCNITPHAVLSNSSKAAIFMLS